MKDLPSLRTLRAFEAAARLRSYSSAARELGVTHGAISHAMRDLELRLETTLFRRMGNAMTPTVAAQRILPTLRQSLGLLTSIFPVANAEGPVHLRISVLPSLASHWLMPRLAEFHAEHPDVAISLDSRLELATIGGDGVDGAIRFGRGNWANVSVTGLMAEAAFPVCTPAYAKRLALNIPADLRRCRLLRHSWQPWTPWFHAAGLDLPEPATPPPFDDAGLLIDAVLAGEGVALARRVLAEDSLTAGDLCRPFALEIPIVGSYYLARSTKPSPRDSAMDCFQSWLKIACGTNSCVPPINNT